MTTYAVIRKSDQVEVHRYDAESAAPGAYPFETHDHLALSYAALQTKRVSRLAFLNRFTDPEAITIDLASQGATTQAASMRRYMLKVNAAEYIDLGRDETRGGVQALEAAGVLAAGRALQILDALVKVHEMYDREFLELPAYSIPEPDLVLDGGATVYAVDGGVIVVEQGGQAPAQFQKSWVVSPLQAALLAQGAETKVQGTLLMIRADYQATVE